jgi:catechol 2,3-dioxygenase-like lactoylglutathione lyase family enzyme
MPRSPAILGLDHVAIAVPELEPAARLYARLLGRDPVAEGGAATTRRFRVENAAIELLHARDDERYGPAQRAALHERLARKDTGVVALTLGVANAADAADALHGVGIAAAASGLYGELALPVAATRGLMLRIVERDAHAAPMLSPVAEGIAESAAATALDHVVVRTSDGDAWRRILGDQLAIRLALDHSRPEWGVRQLFFRTGGTTIEVVQPLEAAKRPRHDSFWGVAWRTRDLAAMHARLVAAGVDVSEVRTGRKAGTSVATVRNRDTLDVPTLLIEDPSRR